MNRFSYDRRPAQFITQTYAYWFFPALLIPLFHWETINYSLGHWSWFLSLKIQTSIGMSSLWVCISIIVDCNITFPACIWQSYIILILFVIHTRTRIILFTNQLFFDTISLGISLSMDFSRMRITISTCEKFKLTRMCVGLILYIW